MILVLNPRDLGMARTVSIISKVLPFFLALPLCRVFSQYTLMHFILTLKIFNFEVVTQGIVWFSTAFTPHCGWNAICFSPSIVPSLMVKIFKSKEAGGKCIEQQASQLQTANGTRRRYYMRNDYRSWYPVCLRMLFLGDGMQKS